MRWSALILSACCVACGSGGDRLDGGPDDAGADAVMPADGGSDAGVDSGGDAGLDAGPDGGPGDAGTDGAAPDAGGPDAGGPDAGSPDAGGPDAGAMDAGAPDAGAMDAGGSDAGPVTGHIVFVSSGSYPASFGGLAGADGICQSLASGAGLTGTYRAILSDATADARDRLVVAGPVRDTGGTLIASGPGELWGGSIRARIRLDERRLVRTTDIVWTGTDADGVADRATTTYCGNWTSIAGGVEAGRTDATDARWISIYGTSPSSAHACTNSSHLYCLSQP